MPDNVVAGDFAEGAGKTMKNRTLAGAALLGALFLHALPVFSCSIFKYADGEHVYFSGNEDWTATDPAIMTLPAAEGAYGVVLLGWKSFLPRYPQAGINSEGLSFDWAVVPSQNYRSIPGKDDLTLDSTIQILQLCKTVDEVVKLLERYNFSHLAEEHIMFADRTGKSCVIEYTKGERRIVMNDARAQYITNFNLTDKEAGWYPCERYAKLDAAFGQSELSETQLIELLDSVHQEGQYPTIYSYVFDLTTLRIKLFFNHHYGTFKEYSVNQLLEKAVIIPIN